MNEYKPCWLFDQIPNTEKAKIFFKQAQDSGNKRYNDWAENILEDVSTLNYTNLRAIYVSSLNQFDIGYTSTYEGIANNQRKKIVEDLTRTLQKIRHDFDPNVKPPNDKEKELFCAILRITLSLHLEKDLECNLFKYRQSLIELILPFYHVVWYALDPKDTYLIESITKYLFKKFMKKTKHIYKMPGSTNFQAYLQNFENDLNHQEHNACEFLKNNDIQLMIPFKWYSLLFTHEYTFDIVILIWDELMKRLQPDKFNDNLIKMCAGVLKKINNECIESDKQHIVEALQDISNIEILEIMNSKGLLGSITDYIKFKLKK